MPDQPKKFYLTTPIYYVNARPHIGHAYTTIAADVLARRHRLLGEDVFFLTGTDEHGQKIERSAAAAGIPPQQFADEVAASFEALWKRMGITNDKFIRTTSPEHKRGVQKLWRELESRGAIYLDSYTGAYCVSDETFVDQPAGTPCPDCGRPLEIVTEENFFFDLKSYQEKLINLIESEELSVGPESRRNEVLSFVRGNIAGYVEEWVEGYYAKGGPKESFTRESLGQMAFEELPRSKAGNPYIPGALKDLSISRTSFQWGIPVPSPATNSSGAPSVPESHPGTGGKEQSSLSQNHVIYVWLDALTNYMSAVGYGSDAPEDIASFEKYWPADLHLVGKEIIRFHCVYWPAFLLAAGLPLPKKIQAHGWLLFEESKMSKSRGNIVRTETILDAFGDHYRASLIAHNKKLAADAAKSPADTAQSAVILSQSGAEAQNPSISPFVPEPTKEDCDLFAADVLRYFLLREIPFGQDGSFSFDALITRYNADLANGYGNLVSRTLNMVEKYFGGRIPEIGPDLAEEISGYRRIQETANFESGFTNTLIGHLDRNEFDRFLQGMSVQVIGVVDQSITYMAPWKEKDTEANTDKARRFALYYAAESIRIITALLHPVMPHTTAKVWAQLGLDPADLDSTRPATSNQQLATLAWGGLRPGTKLGPLAPIFPRAPKELAQVMSDMEAQNNPAKPEAASSSSTGSGSTKYGDSGASLQNDANSVAAAGPQSLATSPQISIDDFAKVDLRVARVLVAERIPKADKLLRLEVDLGYEKRQVLAGIAQYYEPEKLIGRKVVIVANLAPRKMRGLESQGMIVAASIEPDGAPALAGFLEDVEIGARLK